MNAEHPTPVGAPVVIAPGKIILVGDCACVEDSPVMVAAIARHARAQFVPRIDAMPKLVADVVKRAQRELSDVITALPLGSVLVDDEDFRHKVPLAGLGASAAVSVAAAGALLETLGLSVGNRKSQILAIAGAADGEPEGRAGSAADALAAAYGGLVQVSRGRDTAPRAFPVVAPNGLRLVLFSAPPAISPQRMAEGIQRYAESDPLGFEDRTRALRTHAQRFVDEIKAGQTTGAIAAARKYCTELGSLGKAARVPIATEAFDSAAELARELGGVAKSTGAGDGSVGVAMFATREAAELFRKAIPPGITLLDGDLDRLGVRCQGPSDEFDADPTEVALAPSFASAEEPDEPVPEDQLAMVEGECLPLVQTAIVVSKARDLDRAPSAVVPLPSAVPPKSRHRWLRGLALAALGAAVLLAVAWLAVPDMIPARFRPKPSQIEAASPRRTHTPSPPTRTEPSAVPASPPPAERASPPHVRGSDEAELSAPLPAPVTDKPRKTSRSAAATSRKPARASGAPARMPSVRRAGKLSLDDF